MLFRTGETRAANAEANKPRGNSKPYLATARTATLRDVQAMDAHRDTVGDAHGVQNVRSQLDAAQSAICGKRAGLCQRCYLNWRIDADGETQFCCDVHLLLVADLYDTMQLTRISGAPIERAEERLRAARRVRE